MAVLQQHLLSHPECGFTVDVVEGRGDSLPHTTPALTLHVSGNLDEADVAAFANVLMDVVFTLPVHDVVLDMRETNRLCGAARDIIGNADLALRDQGADLELVL